MQNITVHHASENNLANISLTLPREKLIVFTGVSGSGKSSLAFDTIFVEGQRRYVESMNAYARQFIEQFSKPALESIEGLSPAIAIDQKSSSNSPRSTVGTVTEIYDFLRVLYARVGRPHCPECGEAIHPQSEDQIVASIAKLPEGTKLQILAPVVRGRKGEYNAQFNQWRKEGFVRVRIDGEIHLLEEMPDDFRLEKTKRHNIELVIDRLIVKPEDSATQLRLSQSVATALKKADGMLIAHLMENPPLQPVESEQFFSEQLACPHCQLDLGRAGFQELAPRMFSFNSPYGACETCEGLGLQYHIHEQLLIPDPSKSLIEGAIIPFEKTTGRYFKAFLKKLAKTYGIRIDVPYDTLSPRECQILLYGDSEADPDTPQTNQFDRGKFDEEDEEETDWFQFVTRFDGMIPILNRRLQHGSASVKQYIEGFLSPSVCTQCQGARLKPISLSVTIDGHSIHALCQLSIEAALHLVQKIPSSLSENQRQIAREPLKEVEKRLEFLLNVGLDYLTLGRAANSLSGGEAQRIRLATQIGSGLSGVLYILDEPSIGLHQHNNRQLIQTLQTLRDQGNTLIVVEHDEDMIRAADWVVDIGPGAGIHGGRIVAEGSARDIEKIPDSLTGQYLSGKRQIKKNGLPRKGSGKFLTLKDAHRHNLKHIDVAFPLGTLTCVTGLSGSGKSTLVFDLLYEALGYHFLKHKAKPSGYKDLKGLEHLDKFIVIDQAPIGRTSRSNPATYIGLFDSIRNVFANTEEAKVRGYQSGRFSFNVAAGRCETCQGNGTMTLAMNFLPDVHIQCEQCNGARYNLDTLSVTYRGKTIADVLAMSVAEARILFEEHPKIERYLQTLCDVGLDYIHLGQPAPTLSGGEAQRLKLASEFCKRSTGSTLYLLDEPTVGLHWQDLENLITILDRLVEQGNTVVVIEHHLDFIKTADYVIDMGPEGGERGGIVVATGTPDDIAQNPVSLTGRYLLEMQERPAISLV
ncbi:MAG: excinuclease ABC subunit UvrA [Cyanobacteria bacterium]|nr:excinuclease ABC subunit UvrA [Cyanobacteriota bacterium]